MRYRNAHKAEIKRRMYRATDRKWDMLFTFFSSSILFLAYGIVFLLTNISGGVVFGVLMLMLSALFFFSYRWLLGKLQTTKEIRIWLSGSDEVIVTLATLVSVALSEVYSENWLFLLAVGGAYGTYKLWIYSKPYWRFHFFRAAREYFRELSTYRPNKQRQHRPSGRTG
ncbi:MAG: hypothetical protein ACJAWL_001351 [Motiliproteus sp.]|jgi:hypothetical protein